MPKRTIDHDLVRQLAAQKVRQRQIAEQLGASPGTIGNILTRYSAERMAKATHEPNVWRKAKPGAATASSSTPDRCSSGGAHYWLVDGPNHGKCRDCPAEKDFVLRFVHR